MVPKELEKYLKGKGLNVSEIPEHSLLAPHFYQIPSNLYRPAQFFSNNSLDFIYCNDVTATKFYKILLKEWFDLIKVGGTLVLLSCPGNVVKTLFGKTAEIIYRKDFKEENILVVKKKAISKRVLGDIDSWTFGIITGGTRFEEVKAFVKSVRTQKVSNYEIIISGKWEENLGKDVKVLDQSKAASKGHITKMKNEICKLAKYENILIVHDRVILDKNWHKGIKLYGNAFELLAFPQLDAQGKRAGDWLTSGDPFYRVTYKFGMLEYDDWDRFVFVPGTATAIKKSLWKDNRWNENVFWNQAEDVELSLRLEKKGFLSRINPHSILYVNNWRHGNFPLHSRNLYKLGRKQGMYLRRFVWFMLRIIERVPFVSNLEKFVFKKFIDKSKIKVFILNH